MNVENLQEELMRMGRRPVPGPRPEFADSLLARIQMPDESARLAPVISLNARRPLLRRSVLLGAAGALAAASLAAVAISSVQDTGPSSVSVKAISGPGDVWEADLTGLSGKRAIPCPTGANSVVLKTADSAAAEQCRPGTEIQITLDRGRITSGPKLEAAATTTSTLEKIGLRSAEAKSQVELDWDAYKGPNFGSYLVLRRRGLEAPTFPATAKDVIALSSTDPSRKTFVEQFDDAAPDADGQISYLVVVLDSDGKQIGRSNPVRVPIIGWQPKATAKA